MSDNQGLRKFWNDIIREHAALMEISVPKLEPVDISIRPLNPAAWPALACGCRVECVCGEKR